MTNRLVLHTFSVRGDEGEFCDDVAIIRLYESELEVITVLTASTSPWDFSCLQNI